MFRSRVSLVLPFALLLPAAAAAPQDVVKRVGRVTFVVDSGLAIPGGFFLVRLQSPAAIGAASAILDGRRAPFHLSPRGPRAIVPIPVTAVSGPNALGIEITGRRGRQRIPLEVTIGQRPYPARLLEISDKGRSLLERPEVTHDARVLLGLLRTQTRAQGSLGPFVPPVDAPGTGFGAAPVPDPGYSVEPRFDSIYGEAHRGLDYEVAAGTPVRAPAAGTVVFAGPLALPGQTIVIDHGQGVMSTLLHLSRIDVAVGQPVAAQTPLGLSGDTGLCAGPKLEWRVYVNATAVDPRLLDRSLD
jgi:hypothetical protein